MRPKRPTADWPNANLLTSAAPTMVQREAAPYLLAHASCLANNKDAYARSPSHTEPDRPCTAALRLVSSILQRPASSPTSFGDVVHARLRHPDIFWSCLTCRRARHGFARQLQMSVARSFPQFKAQFESALRQPRWCDLARRPAPLFLVKTCSPGDLCVTSRRKLTHTGSCLWVA